MSTPLTLRRSVPPPVRSVVRQVRRNGRDSVDALKLLAGRRELRQRYGSDFLLEVDPRDELAISGDGRFCPGAQLTYLRTGEQDFREFQAILEALDVHPDRTTTLLDFASGYGRLLRFFVTLFTPERITIADIDHAAVDFAVKHLGIRGFYATGDPAQFRHHWRYDLIFVSSLFSRLPRGTWADWLGCLAGLLNPDGRLIFATRSGEARGDRRAERAARARESEPGFRGIPRHPTSGRRSIEQSGTACVGEDFVRAQCDARGLTFERSFPRGRWGSQDVCVVKR